VKPATTPPASALERQKEIYILGAAGHKPHIPVDFDQLEASARAKMSREAFAYVAGGAGEGQSIIHNRRGFHSWKIVPRMLRNVEVRDTSVELFGRRLPAPLLLAPVGVLDLAHRQADLAVARAAAALGIPMIFSNQASVPMEACAGVMADQPRWFQLYWSKSNELVESLVQRAENCGCEAIVVTLDTTLLGWRTQDLDLAYLPFLQGKGIAQYVSDPVFQQLVDQPPTEAPPERKITLKAIQTLLQLLRNYPGSFWQNLRSGRPLRAVRTFVNMYSRPSLNWEDLPFLRERTRLPILLKGILQADDARKALDYGINGLIVSNHGGRQIDGSISSIEALPAIAEAVNGQIPILLDSGVRGGADMFKALALGATAVCIGRPYVYALALAGEKGVRELLRNYLADFELTMGLSGCKSVAEIKREMLLP